MDKKKALMMGAAVVTLTMPAAQKALAAQDTLNIDAVVIQAIKLTATQNLDFGTFAPQAIAGSVVVSPAGVVTPANVTHLGGHAEGKLDLAAAKGFPITLDFTGTTAKIAHTVTATKTMVVKNFLLDAAGKTGAGPLVITLTAGTTAQVSVGATLNVNANQTAGTYAGSIDVTAVYQ